MSIHERIYRCSATEWCFARIFQESNGQTSGRIDETLKGTKKGFLRALTYFLLAGGIVVLSIPFKFLQVSKTVEVIISMVFLFALLFFALSGVVSAFRTAKELQYIKEQHTNYPQTHHENPILYIVADQGLYYNFYNKTDKRDMRFIPWDDVKDMDVHSTRFYTDYKPKSKLSGRRLAKKEFEKIKGKAGALASTSYFSEKDNRSVFLVRGNYLRTQLPIPESWELDGKMEGFTTSLQQHIGSSPS